MQVPGGVALCPLVDRLIRAELDTGQGSGSIVLPGVGVGCMGVGVGNMPRGPTEGLGVYNIASSSLFLIRTAQKVIMKDQKNDMHC